MKYPDNLYSLSDHMLYVIKNNINVERKFFSFNDFTKCSISNHVSKLINRGLIKKVNGILSLDIKGEERYVILMDKTISTQKLNGKLIDLLGKGDSTVANMAESVYPDVPKKTRESIVRASILSLVRKNKVQAGHMLQRHRMYTTNFKITSKMDTVKISNTQLLKKLVAVTVNRKKDYE